MRTEPAPEASTRLRADADELLDRAEASASADGGDITAEAEVIWAR